jgi:hypothetical protein
VKSVRKVRKEFKVKLVPQVLLVQIQLYQVLKVHKVKLVPKA